MQKKVTAKELMRDIIVVLKDELGAKFVGGGEERVELRIANGKKFLLQLKEI